MKRKNRSVNHMFMSLFFLFFTILTFFGAHYRSKKTRPNREQSFMEQDFVIDDITKIHLSIKNWIKQNKNLNIVEQNESYYLISESSTLLSYGFFYHIHIVFDKKPKIEIAVQAKLVSSPYDKKSLTKNLSTYLELKNVS